MRKLGGRNRGESELGMRLNFLFRLDRISLLWKMRCNNQSRPSLRVECGQETSLQMVLRGLRRPNRLFLRQQSIKSKDILGMSSSHCLIFRLYFSPKGSLRSRSSITFQRKNHSFVDPVTSYSNHLPSGKWSSTIIMRAHHIYFGEIFFLN